MSKNFGVKPYLFPMPTYMIGTYNEDDTVGRHDEAWGGICAEDMVALNLEAEHKTVANLETRKAFTLAVPGTDSFASLILWNRHLKQDGGQIRATQDSTP